MTFMHNFTAKELFPGGHAQMEAIQPEIQAKECLIEC